MVPQSPFLLQSINHPGEDYSSAPAYDAPLVHSPPATFDLSRFLSGFSTNRCALGRMLDVKVSYVENKDIKMGLTFLNSARGFSELVLVTNRDSEAKTLPYLNSIGVVSRKAISALKKTDEDSGNKDDDGEEPSSDPKAALSKKMDAKERRSTERSLTDVHSLLRFDGMEGHAVYTNVVSTYFECHNYATLAHPPMLHRDDVKSVTKALICFTNIPHRREMRCSKHPYGCGLSLKVGSLVRVNGMEKCRFIKGMAWYFPVWTVDSEAHLECCVGIVKTLTTQGHLVANRTAIATQLVKMCTPSSGAVGVKSVLV
jgi:hypothetical protein